MPTTLGRNKIRWHPTASVLSFDGRRNLVREIKSICFKRIHLRPLAGDKAGHWWFEIGPADAPESESYGWWPKHPVSLADVFVGVEGELNDGLSSNVPARDPH